MHAISMRAAPELVTPRLHLRALRQEDAPAVQRLAGDRQVADTTLHIPHPYPDGAAEAWIAMRQVAWEMGQGLALAVTLRETGELIGAIGMSFSSDENAAELGYWIGVPWWNRGYCSEAARAVVDYAFRELRVARVHAHHFARNRASGRVLEKAGLLFERERTGAVMKWGRAEDVRYYALTRAAWRSSIAH